VCTVLVLLGVNPDHPLIVAANRDELLARPWTPPSLIAPGVVAPRDTLAGGSWMGATASGFFAALTNIHTPARAPRSRGAVVLAVLAAGTVAGADALLGALRPGEHAPFNLLYGHADRVRLARSTAEGVTFEEVTPGLRVLPNGPLDAPLVPKVERARALVGPVVDRPWPELLPLLHRALGDHHGELPLASICVHRPPFGTGSSTVLALDRGRTAAYLFAAGPPCVTPLADVTGRFLGS
jgi:uncharacterized protein with NRDE domain